jgi:hypothetical protein
MSPAMLPVLVLLLGLAQEPEPRLFLWTIIESLVEGRSTILVTVTPTPFGLVSGVDIKSIAVVPVPTRDDPKPRTVQPAKSEPTPRWGLQAAFPMPTRRFHLKVTFSDGSVHDVDVYRQEPPSDPKILRVEPEQLISLRRSWG